MFPIATASTPDFPVVLRLASSQTRDLPLASVYVAFWSLIHLASVEGRSVRELILGVLDWEDILVMALRRATRGEVGVEVDNERKMGWKVIGILVKGLVCRVVCRRV